MHINSLLQRDSSLIHRLFLLANVPAFGMLFVLIGSLWGAVAEASPPWPAAVGLPVSADRDIRLIENDGFVIGYDEALARPAWVAYRVAPVAHYIERPRPPFVDDPRFDVTRDTRIYAGPQYDRGHLAPNYAMSQLYGQRAQRESFYYTNIVAQRPRLNQLIWQRLEEIEIDDVAALHSPLWVMLGPVFADNNDRPAAFFRIWLANTAENDWQAIAFIVPQSVRGDERLSRFVVPIDRIEAATGLNFMPALAESDQARLEGAAAPEDRFNLNKLACRPARYASRWQGRDGIRLDFDRCGLR